MDFTLTKYRELLIALRDSSMQYNIRHDVDLRPGHSLRVAQIEKALNIQSTYYFRTVPESFDEHVIKEIANLGHAIGYHYESLSTTHGDIDKAYSDFVMNIERLRQIVPIKTICMHGSPRTKWDNRDLWKYYNYHDLGIDNEPYLDTDWSKALYLTDTGRRWDGYKVSLRDKIPQWQDHWNNLGLSFHTSNQIIKALNDAESNLRKSNLKIHITTHPQRWSPFGYLWMSEFVIQNSKNIVKRCINHIHP